MAAVNLQLRLLDLMWEQVLCKHFLPYLSLKELFQLRGISREFRQLVDLYFSLAFTVHINKAYSLNFSSAAFEVLTNRTCCLRELTLDTAGSWLTDESVTAVLQNNPNLDTVDLSRCSFLTDTGVGTVGEHCRKVRTLSLEQCAQVTGCALQSFSDNNAGVEYVNLSGCSGLTEDDLIKLVTHCKRIKYFMLDMMHHITNRTVAAIARSCPGLLQLNVQMSWRLTDHCVHILREFCPNLESLQVMNCKHISESSLAKLRQRNVRIDKPADAHYSQLHGVRYQI